MVPTPLRTLRAFATFRRSGNFRRTFAAPRVARAFYQNIGTIHTESMVQVQLKRRNLGQVEESFMKAVKPGDVFVLNGRCVRLVKAHLLTAHVVAADYQLPTIPRWYANKMPLASGLAAEVVRLRTELARRLNPPSPLAVLPVPAQASPSASSHTPSAPPSPPAAGCSTPPPAPIQSVLQYSTLSPAVTATTRGNTPRTSRSQSKNVPKQSVLQYSTLSRDAGGAGRVPEADVRALFRRDGAEGALRAALAEASLVKWQFRGVAQTGLMVPRRVHGQERGARALQWSAELIFEVLRKHEPDHPLLLEAYAEATLRFLDLPRALAFLETLPDAPWDVRELSRVSPFSFGIYVSKIKETMTLEDPETTLERLYHAMYGSLAAPAPAGRA